MTIEYEKQIIEKIERGDIRRVAEITGINAKNCSAIVYRQNSKRHKYLMNVLENVINEREETVTRLKKKLLQDAAQPK